MAAAGLVGRGLSAADLPLTVEVDARHSMTGAPLPPVASVEVRVDSDGNPLTKDPSDPVARASGVSAGQGVTTLVLKRGG